MTIFVPNYYDEFKCIADKCKHNCCIGWEIDVDENTLEKYKKLDKRFGTGILDTICMEDTPHFVLCENERCSQLDEKGLCKLISRFGEEALCNICNDHPRFRNYFENFTEMGLGLCCEEAVRIVLSCQSPFCLVPLRGEESVDVLADEKDILCERESIFSVLGDRTKGIKQRLERLSDMYGISLSDMKIKDVASKYLSLERLDEKWTELLKSLEKSNETFEELSFSDKDTEFEQLSCYLIFRHYADFSWEGCEKECVFFVLTGCFLIASLCEKFEKRQELQLCELVRMFSGEVEYSEDNVNCIMNDWI